MSSYEDRMDTSFLSIAWSMLEVLGAFIIIPAILPIIWLRSPTRLVVDVPWIKFHYESRPAIEQKRDSSNEGAIPSERT